MNTATTALMFSSVKMDYGTPPQLFAQLHEEFRFTLDAAASAENHFCNVWLGPGSKDPDALACSWGAHRCFLNPPYGRVLGQFIAKAAAERLTGALTVALIPSRTDTRYFHDHLYDARTHTWRPGVAVRFLKGRIAFRGADDPAPFPSMLAIFRP